MNLINHLCQRCLLALWAVAILIPAGAQDKPFRNSVGVSYTTLRFLPHEQYIGAGIEYSFYIKPWIGLQAQLSKFPQRQGLQDDVSGGAIVQETGSILVGHRWRKVGIHGQGGAGVLRMNVFKGASLPDLVQIDDVRHYPEIIVGGIVDVAVGRRWSMTFHARDNITWIGSYNGISLYGPTYAPPGFVNVPEGGAGLAFHF